MGFWAEEWWQSSVCEQGSEVIRTTTLRMMRASLPSLLICLPGPSSVEQAAHGKARQLLAAETIFQLLGCTRDFLEPDDVLCKELLDALVFACQTAVAQCRQACQACQACQAKFPVTEIAKVSQELSSTPEEELAAATLRCLGRMATESVEVISGHLSRIAPTVLQSVQGTPSAVAVVAVEFWSSLALQDAAAGSSGTYAGDGMVAEFIPELVPLLLKILAASDSGCQSGDSAGHGGGNLVEAASVSLQLLVKVDHDEECIHQICQFLCRSEEGNLHAGPGHGDLLALEALLESSGAQAADAVFRCCRRLSVAICSSTASRDSRAQAAKTATRALQMHADWVPQAVKESWLQTSLLAIRDASVSFEFGQLLQELMSCVCASPQHFDLLASQLLVAFEEVPLSSPARPALLRALACLIESSSGCEVFLGPLLSRFLGALQRCHCIDGAGSCLKALVLRLGSGVAEFAGRLLQFCASSSAKAILISECRFQSFAKANWAARISEHAYAKPLSARS